MKKQSIKDSSSGNTSAFIATYTPFLLFPMPRRKNRAAAPMPNPLPFQGVDVWNAYEMSWLNMKGKPEIAMVEFTIPADSPHIIEAKSLKLYLNSFTQTKMESPKEVLQTLERDLSHATGKGVTVKLIMPEDFGKVRLADFEGDCIDTLDIATDTYHCQPKFLKAGGQVVEEKLFTRLMKANCLSTGQPDWGHIYIHYKGPKIQHEGLLKYFISFRTQNEFHEECVEQVFMDISNYCKPSMLTVYGRYTRRGGIDINPFRSNWETLTSNLRHIRQ